MKAIVYYPPHIVLLNFSYEFSRYFNDYGYTCAGLLAVLTAEDDLDELEHWLVEVPKSQLLAVDLANVLPASVEETNVR